MSAVFVLDQNARVLEEWFGKTPIHSDKRFAHEEAQEILDNKKGEFTTSFPRLTRLPKNWLKSALKKALFRLTRKKWNSCWIKAGVPIKVYKKTPQDTNKLIEEFILLANKKVASFVANMEKESVFVYRVHDNPDYDRMHNLTLFLKSLGYGVKTKDGIVEGKELEK